MKQDAAEGRREGCWLVLGREKQVGRPPEKEREREPEPHFCVPFGATSLTCSISSFVAALPCLLWPPSEPSTEVVLAPKSCFGLAFLPKHFSGPRPVKILGPAL